MSFVRLADTKGYRELRDVQQVWGRLGMVG